MGSWCDANTIIVSAQNYLCYYIQICEGNEMENLRKLFIEEIFLKTFYLKKISLQNQIFTWTLHWIIFNKCYLWLTIVNIHLLNIISMTITNFKNLEKRFKFSIKISISLLEIYYITLFLRVYYINIYNDLKKNTYIFSHFRRILIAM